MGPIYIFNQELSSAEQEAQVQTPVAPWFLIFFSHFLTLTKSDQNIHENPCENHNNWGVSFQTALSPQNKMCQESQKTS